MIKKFDVIALREAKIINNFNFLFIILWLLAASQDVTLVIRGRSETGQTIEIRQETTVSSEETQIVRIKIGDLGEGK